MNLEDNSVIFYMENYDFIIIGGGFTGSVLAYELIKTGVSVLLLEKDANLDNATRYSYGGLAYWLATSDFTNETAQKGREYHRNLSQELGEDTEFRELNLLLTIGKEYDQNLVLNNYQNFITQPDILTVKEALELEPLLNQDAISGALRFTHGHINPVKTMTAFQRAFLRLGGKIYYEEVTKLLTENKTIYGVKTKQNSYFSPRTILCSGWSTRKILQQLGIHLNLFFTYEQVIITKKSNINLQCQVMPATPQRLIIEKQAGELESKWDQGENELLPLIIDTGAIQFKDGHLCLGQITQIFPHSQAKIDLKAREKIIRNEITKILPSLANLTGTCHNCLVAFTPDSAPLIGKIANLNGIYTFSGFTSTLLLAPPLARDFALTIDN
jgi:glycine/D-amino acid oxidase-like deaminating enzyme